MHEQTVSFMNISSSRKLVTPVDKYTFCEDKGYVWLQRLCFRVLSKIGAYAQEWTHVYRRVGFDNNDLLKLLLEQEKTFYSLIYNRKLERIYMGPDDYQDLMMGVERLGMIPITFVSFVKICSPNNPYGSWHDIPITVIPWMKGVLMVPKDR